jgi:hypothetical protein
VTKLIGLPCLFCLWYSSSSFPFVILYFSQDQSNRSSLSFCSSTLQHFHINYTENIRKDIVTYNWIIFVIVVLDCASSLYTESVVTFSMQWIILITKLSRHVHTFTCRTKLRGRRGRVENEVDSIYRQLNAEFSTGVFYDYLYSKLVICHTFYLHN